MTHDSVVIGLGSNIDPQNNLKAAAKLLREVWPTIRFSSIYETAPRDAENQPPFLNAAASIETSESAESIHKKLQSIEQTLGKKTPYRFGPRTIDLDLLLYHQQIIPDQKSWLSAKQKNDPDDQQFYIPHLRMTERRFVLEPLSELLDDQWKHPVTGELLSELLEKVKMQECRKLNIQL